jgi:hypothetical protein
MQRRRFMKTLAVVPAAPVLLAQAPAQPPVPAQQPAPPAPPAAGARGGPAPTPHLDVVNSDTVAEPEARFFAPAQFSALQRLSNLLMPPLRGNPGALDAGVPEFIDFLISVSPADRQTLYRTGLEGLNAKAKKQFNKNFADLNAAQCDAIVRPLLVPVPWTHEPPKDPLQHFMAAAHDDIRTATRNSREWNTAAGRNAGRQQFWNPVDPVYKG